MTNQKKGMLWIIVATFFFSLMGSFVKLGATHFSSLELVFYRSFISLLFLFIYIVISKKEIKTPHLRKQIDRKCAPTYNLETKGKTNVKLGRGIKESYL